MRRQRITLNRTTAQFLSLALLLTVFRMVFADEIAVPNTAESINRGRALFMTLCTQCHGHDGKAQIDVVSNATDLTDPSGYRNGRDNASIAKSIKDGAGAVMPAWGAVLKDPADIAHLRNFIQSLWPEAQRPPVVK
jgi:mono/diheme cytochrome c family protein